MLRQKIITIIAKILKTDNFVLLTPRDSAFGDYAVFMKHETGTMKQIIIQLSEIPLFSKVEQKGDFINLYINPKNLLEEMDKIATQKETYGSNDVLNNKKIMIEFAHPNTHKLFHIGHLRNIITGEALSRLLESAGAKIIRTNYQGDVGLHIAKCLFAILKRMDEFKKLTSLDEKIAFLGSTYTQGTVAYEEDPTAKEKIHTINKQIFTHDPAIQPLWTETRGWSLEYFDAIYKRIGTTFDRLFFESEVADSGLKMARDALKKGILIESDGAVILDGTPYGIDKRVFINSLGLPTYEGKELGLAELEFSEFGEIDRCIHVVTPEQSSFFKVVFKVEELLNKQKYEGKQYHFAYEFVDLKSEKMSSRIGNIVTGEWLLDEVKQTIHKTYSLSSQETAEKIALGAVKYAFLKVAAQKKIKFDINESVSIHGNSGPYLQYAYARCQSILKKSEVFVISSGSEKSPHDQDSNLNEIPRHFVPRDDVAEEELSLLHTFPRFPEVVADAAKNYAPHLICTYLYDLAQKFNLFYEKCPILKAEKEQQKLRLLLTKSTAQILKNGLYLLGIEVLDRI